MIKIEGTYNTAIVYADTIEAGAEGRFRSWYHRNSPRTAGFALCLMYTQARAVPLNDHDHYG